MSNSSTLVLPDGRKVRTQTVRRYVLVIAVDGFDPKIRYRTNDLGRAVLAAKNVPGADVAVVFDTADGRIVHGLPEGMSASPLPGGDSIPEVIARHYAHKAESDPRLAGLRPVLTQTFSRETGWVGVRTTGTPDVTVTVDVVAALARRGVTTVSVGLPIAGHVSLAAVADFPIRDGIAR